VREYTTYNTQKIMKKYDGEFYLNLLNENERTYMNERKRLKRFVTVFSTFLVIS
jgi:hypothetical protein